MDSSTTMQSLQVACDARIPVMLVGAPGVGKTEVIREMAKQMGYRLITLIGSQMDPTDIAGLPQGRSITLDDGNVVEATVNLATQWQISILKYKKVILFLDEFSNTSSAVRASMLTVLQNREFPNGEVMPEETIVIGAMNPTDSAADGWDLDKPTSNRMLFLKWDPPKAAWYEGMLTAWGRPLSKEEKYWRRRIVSFLEEQPYLVHHENDGEEGSVEASGSTHGDSADAEILRYAWASRRSWDNYAKALGHVDKKNHSVQDNIGQGLVGWKATSAFRDWQMRNDSIDPRQALEDPETVDFANISQSDSTILFKGIIEVIDLDNYQKVPDLFRAVAQADVRSLLGAYVRDILKKVISLGQPEKEREAIKAELSAILKEYNFGDRKK